MQAKATVGPGLVLGAETPAGSEAALALAESGAATAMVAASSEPQVAFGLRKLERRVAELGVRTMTQAIDASSSQAVQVAVRQVARELGGLESIVWAADRAIERPVARMTDAEWATLVGINLNSAYYALRSGVRELGGRGTIIMVVAEEPRTAGGAADAPKAGVLHLVRAFAHEAGDGGPRIYGLAHPGWLPDGVPGGSLRELVARLVDPACNVPSGSLFGLRQ